ncbi:MAG: hypothetical protein R3321_01260, partial [Nitrososphaeraceae archaeon]|nr:hypothetical protein [Nitrososphaeraceae archaeon]
LEVLREYDKCRDGELKPYYLWISELFKEKEVVKILYEKKDGFIFVNKKDPMYEVVSMEETPKIEIDTRPVGINVPPSFSNYWNEYKHKMEEEKARWIQNMTDTYPTLSEVYDN